MFSTLMQQQSGTSSSTILVMAETPLTKLLDLMAEYLNGAIDWRAFHEQLVMGFRIREMGDPIDTIVNLIDCAAMDAAPPDDYQSMRPGENAFRAALFDIGTMAELISCDKAQSERRFMRTTYHPPNQNGIRSTERSRDL